MLLVITGRFSLQQIVARTTSIDEPREWQHFLHVPSQEQARSVAGPPEDFGWSVSIVPPRKLARREPWCVVAEMRNVVLTADLIRSTRELFESLAAALPGAEYDGWQASVDRADPGPLS
jgi:hypothetical protein